MGSHSKMLDAWFAEPGVAGAFVRAFLPGRVAAKVDGEPELIPGSWVDDGLRGHLSDQLMRVKVRGRELEVLCLLEAKRTNDRFVMAQVLRYMAQLYTALSRGSEPAQKRARFDDEDFHQLFSTHRPALGAASARSCAEAFGRRRHEDHRRRRL